MSNEPIEPVVEAILDLVEEMTDAAVAEATGFHGRTVIESWRILAREKFIKAMNKAAEDAR